VMPDVAEGFSGDQERKLRSRKRSGLNEIGKWREVYRILFPEDIDDIPSPCKKRCTQIAGSICSHIAVCASDVPTDDAKLRQALKLQLSSYVKYLSSELSPRVRRNLELQSPLGSSRLEELTNSGLFDAIMTQCQKDMRVILEEFLNGSIPESRNITLHEEIPKAMESTTAPPSIPEPPNELADGFGPLEAEPMGNPQLNTFPSVTHYPPSDNAAGWHTSDTAYGQFDGLESWSGGDINMQMESFTTSEHLV
jgi:hypothetical protein